MDIQQQFEDAVANSKLLEAKPDNETLLQLYALYKQSTEGDNNNEEPSSPFDIIARAKHAAWESQKGKSKPDAMHEYVVLVNKLKA